MNNKPEVKQPEVKVEKGVTITYVGAGEDSPRVINFMGIHKFVRGKAQQISDEFLLSKIRGNPTFVEGTVDEELLHEIDEEASADAKAQKASDAKVNTAYNKKYKQGGED